MRTYFLLFFASLVFLHACEDGEATQTQSAEKTETVKSDSIIIHEINEYANYVETNYMENQLEISLNPPDNNEKIVWLEDKDGKLLRVIYAIFSLDPYFKHTYYLKDGEIIYYRYQQWKRTVMPRQGSEILCLLHEGKIFSTKSKYLEKDNDDRPLELAKMPYADYDVNPDTMLMTINNYWLDIITKKANGGEPQRSQTTPVDIN